jgi:hypothetical protein
VELTIPLTATPDRRYYVGVVVDEEDEVPDVLEWNNATCLPVDVVSAPPS